LQQTQPAAYSKYSSLRQTQPAQPLVIIVLPKELAKLT